MYSEDHVPTQQAAAWAIFARARLIDAMDTLCPHQWALVSSALSVFPDPTMQRVLDSLGSQDAGRRALHSVELLWWGLKHPSKFAGLFGAEVRDIWRDWGCAAANC